MGSPSEAQKATEQFRNLLDREATAQSREMVRNYAPVYQRLQKDTNDLVRIAQSRGLKPWQVMRMDRMKDLESQYLRNVDRWAKASGETITQAQRNAVGLSRRSAKAVVTAGLPDGVNMDNLARLGVGWNELPEDAFPISLAYHKTAHQWAGCWLILAQILHLKSGVPLALALPLAKAHAKQRNWSGRKLDCHFQRHC